MKKKIKYFLKYILPGFIFQYFIVLRNRKELKQWENKGRPLPPPHVIKQKAIKQYYAKYKYSLFIESGTYLGQMVDVQKNIFKKVISIELSGMLAEMAQDRFKKDKNVTILQGDSSVVIPEILNDINEPVIFWLDGHYSGDITAKGDIECPVVNELNAILNSNLQNYVILIDDARLFLGKNDYPTLPQIYNQLIGKTNIQKFEVKDDIIQIVK